MNFEWLSTVFSEMQFDEIIIIGKTSEVNAIPCHIAAVIRQGETWKICMFIQADMGVPSSSENERMRSRMREQALMTDSPHMKALKVNGQFVEIGSGTGHYLQNPGPDAAMYVLKLMEAGWRMPENHIFYKMDWDEMMLVVDDLREVPEQLQEWESAGISVVWGPRYTSHLIEKPVRLVVTNEQENISGEQELKFTIAGRDGKPQEGICYINRVELVDVWKEAEERYADPEYREQALKHVTPEQFEEIRKESLQILEQECPRGMCHIGVEYECTLDVSLDFYSLEYLESVPKVSEGSAVFLLTTCRPSRERGSHGLEMRAAAIRTPVTPDTAEIQAELFLARRISPEREEVLH